MCAGRSGAHDHGTLERTPPSVIGAGPFCATGQTPGTTAICWASRRRARAFAKRYASLGKVIREAAEAYVQDVRAEQYPTAEHSYNLPEEEISSLGQRNR